MYNVHYEYTHVLVNTADSVRMRNNWENYYIPCFFVSLEKDFDSCKSCRYKRIMIIEKESYSGVPGDKSGSMAPGKSPPLELIRGGEILR